MPKTICLILLSALLAACAAAPDADFRYDLPGPATPWTDQDFDDAPGKFTFAVFSDLTGGEREGIYAVAVAQLQLLRPELILNVGDLIEGGTEDRAVLAAEWDSFDARSERTHARLFHTGGNHDLTNPVQWQVWEERYGHRYYGFRYKDTLFLVLDTEDNPPEVQQYIHEIRGEADLVQQAEGWDAWRETEYGRLEERKSGRIGSEQAAYFRKMIAANPDVRHTFLFMHKPAWERPDEENFATIEAALADRPYTVFHGHVHAYRYLQRHGRDYIRLATTGGVQITRDGTAFDHITLVTVSDDGVDIANLRLDGILDKTGAIPAGGERLCFDVAECGAENE